MIQPDNAEDWKTGEARTDVLWSRFFFFIEMTFPKAGQLIFEDDYRIRLFLPLKNFGFVLFVAINGEILGWVLKPFFGIIHSFSFNSSISILKIQPEWYIYIHWIILVDFFLNKFWICRLFFIMINERTSSIPSHRRIIDSSSVDIYATFVISPLVKLLLGKNFLFEKFFRAFHLFSLIS